MSLVTCPKQSGQDLLKAREGLNSIDKLEWRTSSYRSIALIDRPLYRAVGLQSLLYQLRGHAHGSEEN